MSYIFLNSELNIIENEFQILNANNIILKCSNFTIKNYKFWFVLINFYYFNVFPYDKSWNISKNKTYYKLSSSYFDLHITLSNGYTTHLFCEFYGLKL